MCTNVCFVGALSAVNMHFSDVQQRALSASRCVMVTDGDHIGAGWSLRR